MYRLFKFFRVSGYSDAHPLKIIWVNPNQITYATKDHFRYKWVIDGKWDTKTKPILYTQIGKALTKRFIDNKPWEKTGYPEIVRKKMKKEGSAWGCTCEQDIIDRCNSLDQIWVSLAEEGYKSQKELLQEKPKSTYLIMVTKYIHY